MVLSYFVFDRITGIARLLHETILHFPTTCGVSENSMERMQLSSLMGGTAKHEVERTGVPQEVSALRGRVEVAEERLSMISDKSFKTLQEELSHLRSEVQYVLVVAAY